jgi:hypothetical protein
MSQPTTPTPVAWRREKGQRRTHGRLRSITRHPTEHNRFTVEVVTDRSGNLRTLDTADWEIRVGIGHGIPITRWANGSDSLFDGAA